MCHDMCKCFGRVGENREGMETMLDGREAMRLSVSLHEGSDQGNHWRGLQQVNFNPRSGVARYIALHELLGTQYACQEGHFELQQTAENIGQIP